MLVERARRLLETGGVVYETLPHRDAFTSQGVAAAAHVSGWFLAKVLVVRAGARGPLMVVLPASCRLDTAALARALGEPSVSFLPEAEIQALFPDCDVGAMPPFGQLYGLPVWVDACFPRKGEFDFQAGNHHEVVRIRYADFERLAHPLVAEFCLH
ncbi:MAG TPA: YbaK/EbsC family protein [Vicinamibacteria bacterium]|nr:YbaK/EbsC family protein [Vicinamibacteria bacterium]